MGLKLSENGKFHENSAISVLYLYNEFCDMQLFTEDLKNGLILQ